MYNQLIRSSQDEKLFLIQLLFDGRLQPLKYRLLKILLKLQLIYNNNMDSNVRIQLMNTFLIIYSFKLILLKIITTK